MSDRPYTQVMLLGYNVNSAGPDEIKTSDNALIVMPLEHERIHAGKAWTYNKKHFILTGSENNFLLLVNSGEEIHLRNFGFVADAGPVHLTLYADTFFNVDSLGVQLPVVALNQTLINSPNFTLHGGPFVDAASLGEVLSFTMMPNSEGGPVQSSAGAAESPITEWHLGGGTQKGYLFRLDNFSPNTVTLESRLWIYESEEI